MDAEKKKTLASVFALFGIGICCGLPLISALVGVGAATGALLPLKKIPYFEEISALLSVLLLGYAHFLNWKNKKKQEDCCSVRKESKPSSAILWGATVLVFSLITYNHIIFPLSHKTEIKQSYSFSYEIFVEGMDCPSCFKAIESSVKKIDEKIYLVPDFENQILHIYSEKQIDLSKVVSAIEETGYTARVIDGKKL